MSAQEEVDLDALGASLVKAKSLIRQLKQEGAPGEQVKAAVDEMKTIQEKFTKLQLELAGPVFDREGFEDCLLRRMIVVPSFECHGGVAGLFDLGPVGCSLKENILDVWKRHFIIAENMLQVEATCLTPSAVLQASGHVERFADFMVKDPESGVCYRADKLLEDHIENLLQAEPGMEKSKREELELIFRQADAYSQEELGKMINEKFQIKAPDTGNALSDPFPFNLMFKTTIGPEGNSVGFLRPETAQGLFVNFKRLMEFNYGKMPFAAAQIGLGFRNEINPRNGLIRVREFCMAEVEYFVDPQDKTHPKFAGVKDHIMTLFPAQNQMTTGKVIEMTAGEAVSNGVIANETLAYFMVRTHKFFEIVGIDMKKLRFRQHLSTEKAHYSTDCWDAEIKLSMGWVECVGHADRACFDLKAHSDATSADLRAARVLDPPKQIAIAVLDANKKVMGKVLKRDSAAVLKHLESIEVSEACAIGKKLESGETVSVKLTEEKVVELTPDMLKISEGSKTIHQERYYPSVIEPSFGIGRILHAVLEHNFAHVDEDGDGAVEDKKSKKGTVSRTTFRFSPRIAPYKVAIYPLMRKTEVESVASQVMELVNERGLTFSTDFSGVAIGRKYSRGDEIGIPFAITADGDSITDSKVTLRERDSQKQVRLLISEVVDAVDGLCTGRTTWEKLVETHGLFAVSS